MVTHGDEASGGAYRGPGVGVAAAVGGVLGLALTFPLVLHLRSAFLEDGSYDAFQFAWNLWWVRESLVGLHTNPFFTRHLFYPDGVPLLFHTFSFSLGLASVPLQALPGGVVTAHNLLVIAAPALAVLATALLAREVVGDGWAALAAGLVAGLNPIAVWFLPVLYLSCGYLIAALLWTWWRMQRRRRVFDAALALGVLAALVFASQEYAMMGLALLALDTVGRFAAPRLLGLRPAWRAGTLGFWALAALGLGGLALVALSAPAEPPPLLHLLLGSGYVAGLVTPPWAVAPPVRFWSVLYLGTAPLLVLLPALLLGGPRSRFWILALLAMVSMALGPYLHVRHPGLQAHTVPGALESGLRGPYLLALQLVPLLRFFRAPYRWMAAAQVALAVTSGIGVAALRARVRSDGLRAGLTAALLAAIVAAAALDVRGLRAPLASAAVPRALDVLRDDPEPAAVLELPSGFVNGTLALFSSRYMYYQTAHGKPLLEGTVSRLPPGRLFVWQRQPSDLIALPYVKYVVIHHDLLDAAHPTTRQRVAEVSALLEQRGTLVADADGVTVHRLRTFRPEAMR